MENVNDGTPKSLKHAAPGQYLGYALQPVRLCFYLLTCPKGAKVSIEHLDDVSIHHANGSVTLEQTKSALKGNPLSNWSEEFWKAISNWIDGLASGSLTSAKSSFQLYVTPPHPAGWSKQLSDASTEDEAEKLWATITKRAKARKVKKPDTSDTYLKKCLDAPSATRNAVLRSYVLVNEDRDPIDKLRALIKTAVGPEVVDDIIHAAIGMAKEEADSLIRSGKPALVDGDAFKRRFQTFVRKINIPGLLSSLTPNPPKETVAAVLSARPTFIRQLELIDAAVDDRVRAISDYLRASADKSAWAERGLVFGDSLAELDETLIARHGLIRGEVEDLHPEKEASIRGRLTYRQCAQVQAPLEGRVVPAHFVHGCFNALADIPRLGWHPDYQSLLERGEA